MVCTNVYNDLKELDGNIKGLRKYIDQGKRLYGKCAQSYKYLADFESQIKGKLSELESLIIKLQLPELSIEDYGAEVEKIHGMIKDLEFDKEKETRNFSSLREKISSKVIICRGNLRNFL